MLVNLNDEAKANRSESYAYRLCGEGAGCDGAAMLRANDGREGGARYKRGIALLLLPSAARASADKEIRLPLANLPPSPSGEASRGGIPLTSENCKSLNDITATTVLSEVVGFEK